MRTIVYFLSLVFLLALIGGLIFYWLHPLFGGTVQGDRLARMEKSPNFKNGVFHNLEVTPSFKEGTSYSAVLWKFFFSKTPNLRPKGIVPAIKTDLKALPKTDLIIWFGHSSYLLQVNQKIILVDPVFSDNASPLPKSNSAYKIAVNYTVADFPEIDYLLISHDHYDHLDYESIRDLREKVKKVICGLGVGAHFEEWKYKPDQIIEGDWFDQVNLEADLKLTFTPARHFSGRRVTRNNTLWTSYVLNTGKYNLFLGGDSGYGKHFQKIGTEYGPFDLAILEDGQYNDAWHYIHSLPYEIIQEADALRAKAIMPVHNSKFTLAMHDWREPLDSISTLAQQRQIPLITPKIGEIVLLAERDKKHEQWWKSVQ